MCKKINQKVIGDQPIAVGRDLHYYASEYENDIGRFFNKIIDSYNEKVGVLFPQNIEKHDSIEEFSCEKLISSLAHLGMPITVIVNLLGILETKFSNTINNVSTVKSSELRRVISESIYEITGHHLQPHDIQTWGDLYIRKYGNPNQRIQVILPSSRFKDIDYSFLKNDLIPDLVESILTKTKFESFKKLVTKTEISRMAKAILTAINDLNIYRIHYHSLLCIAQEIALQPPHPWIVKHAFNHEVVAYDFERVKYHYNRLDIPKEKNGIHLYLSVAREIVHHSCSAILAYYGVYMGCGDLAPFYNLQNVLATHSSGDINPLFTVYPRLAAFREDLKGIGTNINELNRLLKNIENNIKSIGTTNSLEYIEALTNRISLLKDTTRGIVEKSIFLSRLSSAQNCKLASQQEYETAILDLLKCLPDSSLHLGVDGYFWLNPSHKSVLSKLGALLLIAPIYTMDKVTVEQISPYIAPLADRKGASNTVLMISNSEYDTGCYSVGEENDANVVFLNYHEVTDIFCHTPSEINDRLFMLIHDNTF